MTTKTLAEFLATRRAADVKIWMHGEAVPIKEIFYDARVDAYVVKPDLDSKDYRIAVSFCPENVRSVEKPKSAG